jgi:hypothetical protein
MNRLLAILVVFAALGLSPAWYAQTQFPTEQQAEQHCPSDTVVRVNLPTGIYHFKDERWYGATKSGAFVCRKEADQAGDRATRNGQ